MEPTPTPGGDDQTGPLINSETGEVNLETLSQRLGPFAPPDDFEHGDEFGPATPRPVPQRLRTGSFGRRRWSAVLTMFVLGMGFAIFKPIPFVERLSWHVLPLAYLDWIGYGLIAIAVLTAVRNRLSKNRYQFVVQGDPIVGRVLGVFTPLRMQVDPQTKAVNHFFRYAAAVEYVDPDSRKLERAVLQTDDEWNATQLPRFDPGVDAGDYVTLVALPDKGRDSLKLYGFLGLDPDRDFVTRDGRPLTGVSPWAAVLISVLVLAALWFFILALYVLECCMPQEWNWGTASPFLAVGGMIGAIAMIWLIRLEQRKKKELKKSGLVFAGLIGTFLGMLAGAVTLGAVNSAFDHTQPKYQPIRITQHWQTTHNFVFRTYEVEYTPLAGGKSEKHGTSVDDLRKLSDAPLGALEIRQGAMGLDWIAGVHPVTWQPIDGEPTEEEVRDGIELQVPSPGQDAVASVKLAPRLLVELNEQGDRTVPCPAELVEPAIAAMQSTLNPQAMKVMRLRK